MPQNSLRLTIAALAVAGLSGVVACSTDNPFGVSALSAAQTGDLSAGPLSLTAAGNGTTLRGTITVPQGTNLRDENGNLLDSRAVTLEMTVYDGSEASERRIPPHNGAIITDPALIDLINSETGGSLSRSRSVVYDSQGHITFNLTAARLSGSKESAESKDAILAQTGPLQYSLFPVSANTTLVCTYKYTGTRPGSFSADAINKADQITANSNGVVAGSFAAPFAVPAVIVCGDTFVNTVTGAGG